MAEVLLWTKIGAIGQVAAAVATFAATAAALWIAGSERRFKLRVRARLMAIHDVSGNTPTVSIEVENIGHRTARLTGLYWATGFFGPRWLVPKWFRSRSAFQIIDYSWIINENFPWTLEPGEAKSTHFRREEFLKEFVKPEEEDFFRKLPWSSRYRLLRMRVGVGVYTREGIIFGRVDSKLICELENRYPLNN